VVAIDDIEQSLALVDTCKAHFPQLQLVARARNLTHYYQLRARGVTRIERETFESALLSSRSTLELLGHDLFEARNIAAKFKAHNLQTIEAMWPHHQDEERLIAMAKSGRQQLEEFMGQEREAAQARGAGWAAKLPD
jgi:glutathione-regulated potassium-efflux system ancillary protein KefC